MIPYDAESEVTMSSLNVRLRISVWSGLIAGLFTALLTVVVSQGKQWLALYDITTESPVAMATIMIIASFLIVLAVMAFHYRRLIPETDRTNWLYQLFGRIGAALLSAFFMMFVSAILLKLLQNMFPGGQLPIIAAVIVLTLAGAALGAGTASVATTISSSQMLTLSGITLLSGLVIAALMARDRDWWTNSLSFLGWDDGSNVFFDFALILGGLVILAVMGDVVRDLSELKNAGRMTTRSFQTIRILVLGIGLSIILIGLFPTRISTLSFIIHQGSAYVGFGALFVLMGGISRFLSVYPMWFIRLGYILLGGALVAVVLYALFHFISFVMLEIIIIGLVAPWCFIFAQQTDKAVKGETHEFGLGEKDVRRLRFAAVVGGVAGFSALIAALLVLSPLPSVSIFSPDGYSFAAVGLVLSFPLALISTAVSYRRFSNQARHVGSRLIVSVTMAVLVALIVIVLSNTLNATFTGVAISALAASVSIGALALVICFLIASGAASFDGRQELTLTGVVFGVGILVTTTHVADPQWWQHSISFLGHDSGAFIFFSITLALCGLLLIVVGLDILAMLETWTRRQTAEVKVARLGILRVLLLLLGIFTIGVGIFPTTITRITNDLHNVSSHGALVILLLMMFGLNRLVPSFPRQFIIIGYGLGVISIANIVLYFAGAYNYVVMEFILLIILGLWLYLFMRYTRQLTGYRLDSVSEFQPAAER
jgi:hypothetical protein